MGIKKYTYTVCPNTLGYAISINAPSGHINKIAYDKKSTNLIWNIFLLFIT